MADPSPSGEGGFGIYVHWPFCAAKCPYCDFNSHVRRGIDEARYRDGLVRELEHMAAIAPRAQIGSIFFGGGTPSLMSHATVANVLDCIARLWPLSHDVEVTLEANPTSVEAERFRGYRAAGVNRLSIGVQSLDDTALRFLGRLHSAAEARAAIEIARAVFPRISFDLIYARPGQTPQQWVGELEAACDLAADHLSLYQLTIEPETAFGALHRSGRLTMPDDDAARALYDITLEATARRGLPAYEVSNHARPGAECRHNLLYWRYGDYVGVGPGAHGRLPLAGRRTAIAIEKQPERWLARVEADGHGIAETMPLEPAEIADEALLMGLRLREGIALSRFARLSPPGLDETAIDALAEEGLVERLPGGRLRATHSGFAVLNSVVAALAA